MKNTLKQKSFQRKSVTSIGLVLELKKSYKTRYLEIIFLNKRFSWKFNVSGGLGFYNTHSLAAFNFALNLINDLNYLTVTEPPQLQNPQITNIPTIPLTRRLIWEEALPVQKKYGSRYRKVPRNKKLTRVKLWEINESPITTRERIFFRSRPKVTHADFVRYISWGNNLITKSFFLNHFWDRHFIRKDIRPLVAGLLFFSYYYLIIIGATLNMLRLSNYLSVFLLNNAYHSSIIR